MFITLSYDMLCKLSPPCRDEILMALKNSWAYPDVVDELEGAETRVPSLNSGVTISTASPFESAALSFSAPLLLPESVAATKATAAANTTSARKVRFANAADVPTALPSDLYTAQTPAEIEAITAEIESGLFVGPDSWLPGKKHHPKHYDVRKVLMVINKHPLGVSSYTINMALLRMCRTRVTAILRQLKVQGIIQVKTKV
jgi:hypothetical protein